MKTGGLFRRGPKEFDQTILENHVENFSVAGINGQEKLDADEGTIPKKEGALLTAHP